MTSKRTHRIGLLVGAIVVASALPASAAPAASASVLTSKNLYPGTSAATVRVFNNGAGLLGEAITGLRIFVPADEAGVRIGANPVSPAGWSVVATTPQSGPSFLTYTANAGGGIAPGAQSTFGFPLDVAEPTWGDIPTRFIVHVTSDGFTTTTHAAPQQSGALDVTVRSLEIVAGSIGLGGSAGKIEPAQTEFSPGTYEFGYTVLNRAKTSVVVTAKLRSSWAADSVAPASPATVAAGGTLRFGFPVTFHNAASSRHVQLFAEASATEPGKGIVSVARPDEVAVQVAGASTVTLSDVSPNTVPPGGPVTLKVVAQVTGHAPFELRSASITLGSQTIETSSMPATAAMPNDQVVLEFPEWQPPAYGAASGTVTAVFADGNGAGFSATRPISVGVNSNAPAADIQAEPDDDDQTAVKNGDKISVSGVIGRTYQSLAVVLEPNDGPAISVPVQTQPGVNGVSISGSVTPSWWSTATSFTTKLTATLTTGGTTTARGGAIRIDNAPPSLSPAARVLRSGQIAVRFTDALAMRGGCDPAGYTVEAKVRSLPRVTPGLDDDLTRRAPAVPVPLAVVSVSGPDGGACNAQAFDPDGTRLLRVLATPGSIVTDARVRYEPTASGSSKVEDQAKNPSPADTTITTGSFDTAPTIVQARRRDGASDAPYEDAYVDGDGIHANVGGSDGVVVRVRGPKEATTVEVRGPGGAFLASASAELDPTMSFTEADVPLPVSEFSNGSYSRTILMRDDSYTFTPPRQVSVVLDTSPPEIVNTYHDGFQNVIVLFSEPLVGGAEVAGNWFVAEQGQQGPRWSHPEKVEAGNPSSRALTVALNPGMFLDAGYVVTAAPATRYEDRAGNYLLDTMTLA